MVERPSLNGPRMAPRDGGDARYLIVLLHGIGADGGDLIGLGAIYQSVLPEAFVVSPNAPHRCDYAPFGYQWFSIQDLSQQTRLDGARAAAPTLGGFLDAELARHGLSDERLVLAGFSQGAMMALHVGLRRARPPAAIIAHSGLLLGEHVLADEIRCRPPVLLTHGDADDVLPVAGLALAEAALRAARVPVDAHVVPGLGHGIDEATVRIDLDFLARVFGATPAREEAV